MAAAADVQLVNIVINDVELQVPKGELVVEAAKRLGIEIAIFCYHPRMKPVGMCRMCLVEVGMKQPDGTVRKMPKPQTACTLPCSDGLVIYTDTELVHSDRRSVLEFLLVNHPLDCPICDRGGECPLQNNTLFYGPSTSRFVEIKRHAVKAFPLSKHVTLDLERCIQCGRCVRFTEEISGDGQLAFRFRGNKMQPSTFQLTDFDSKFSGNTIEICPVGALTNREYRFRARPWDLQTRPGICTRCSNGCNVYVDYRVDQIVRINGRTNEEVNEEWTCDRGKFGHDVFNSPERLRVPLIRKGDRLSEVAWPEAYSGILSSMQGNQVAALAGGALSNEDYHLLGKLFRDGFNSDNLDHRYTMAMATPDVSKKTTLEELERALSILVFGTSLADEEPIMYLRVRKAWFLNGTKVVVAHHSPTDVDSFAQTILRYKPGSEAALARALAGDMPVVEAAAATGIPLEAIEEARAVLQGTVVVTTRSLLNQANGPSAIDALRTVGNFNQYGLEANHEGAALLGIWPQSGGKDTRQILEGCAEGSIRALWLAGVDPLEDYPDKELVQRALETVEFLVVQHWHKTEAFHYASVVLPMSAPTEVDGTYTNAEGRVQRMRPVLAELGESKPAWRTFMDLALRLRPQTPMFNAEEIMAQIAQERPAFVGAEYDRLGDTGYVLGTPVKESQPAMAPQVQG